MIPKRIVKLNRTGELGTLLQASESQGGKMHFYPADTGQYRVSELPVVTEKDISDTSLEEKIIYLKTKMTWGDVKNTHVINNGEYIIFEVQHKTKDHPIYYHIYLNFVSVTQCYASLDSAIIGLLDYKYQGGNSQAGYMIERMLQMDKTTGTGAT